MSRQRECKPQESKREITDTNIKLVPVRKPNRERIHTI